jgi:hypothetical protein
LVAKLFEMQGLLLPGREGVAFIRRDNAASRAAHSKSGFREMAEFSYEGVDYLVAARTAMGLNAACRAWPSVRWRGLPVC